MKHAGPAALDRLEPFLRTLRALDGLKENTRGNFYRSGRAFLHFHEHGDALFFADVRLKPEADFERHPATTGADRKALLLRVRRALGDGSKRRAR